MRTLGCRAKYSKYQELLRDTSGCNLSQTSCQARTLTDDHLFATTTGWLCRAGSPVS